MRPGLRRAKPLLLLLALGWVGWVLARYQRVDTPEPLLALTLLAGWLALLTLACLGAGATLWRGLAGRALGSWPALPVALAWGAATLMGGAAALAAVGALRTLPLAALLGLLATLGVAQARRLALPCRGIPRHARAPAAVIAVAAVVSLLPVPTASPFFDQLHYHLAFPFHWLRAHHLITFPRQAYSFFPADMGLLYTYPLALLGPWAAQAVHWWMGALAAAAVGALAARGGGSRAGWWAAALFSATPAVLLSATWAAADLGAAAFGAVALLMVVMDPPRGERSGIWMCLAGAMAGVAAGCKLLAVATVAGPVFLALLAGPGARLRRAVPWLAGAALTLSPWLVRNLGATGDPFFPFLSGVFPPAGGLAAPADLADRIASAGGETLDLGRLASLATFSPAGDAGPIGPLYLAALPLAGWAALAGRRGQRQLGLAALAGVAGWGVGPPLGRYLLPVLAPLAALAAAGWCRLVANLRGVRHWLTGAGLAALAWAILGGLSPLELERAACTLGRGSPDALMRRNASYWPAVRVINQALPAAARVLLVGESRCFGIDRDVVVEDPFHTPLLVELAETSGSPVEMASRLRAMGVTHLLLNRQEARRLAALNRRDEYFAPMTPAGRERLAGLLATCLWRPVGGVAGADDLEILAVKPGCG